MAVEQSPPSGDGIGSTRASSRENTSRPINPALLLYLILAIAVSVKTVISPVQHTVFPKLAARALNWWDAHPLYTLYEGLGRFPYSPSFAIALTPFALAGLRVGGIAWSLLGIAAYVWALRGMMQHVLPGRWSFERQAAFMAIAFIGLIRGTWNAQSNALIIALLMVGLTCVARQRWWIGAAAMSGAVYIKVWPLVLPLLVAALFPRRFILPLGTMLIAGVALPFATQSPDVVIAQYKGWYAQLSTMSGEVVGSYRDLWTALQLLGCPLGKSTWLGLQVLTGLGVLAWCLYLQRGGVPERRLLTLTLGMASCWMLIFGPAVEYNTVVVLAPVLGWGLLEALERRLAPRLAAAAYLTTMLLAAGAMERLLVRVAPLFITTLAVGTALFALWLVLYARAYGTAPAQDAGNQGPPAMGGNQR